MPKNFFQDMVKIKNENRAKSQQKFESPIQEPILENFSKPSQETSQPEPPVETKFISNYDVIKEKRDTSKGKSKYAIWLVAGIAVIFLFFALSFLFSKATITINPKIKNITLNADFSAVKDGAVDTLPFDLVAIEGTETKNIQGGAEKDVLTKAEGVVIIYNAFSSASQNLDINTRLEGSNGKIYKTKTKIIVPGMKGNTPGKVEVGIYGSEAGAEYNSGPLDFKILGFKGTSKYDKFNVRSNVDDTATAGKITGGFKGKSIVVSSLDKTSTISELKATLRGKLFKKITIPSGLILFKDAVFLNISDEIVDASLSSDGTTPISIKGTLYGFLFDETKLTKKVVEKIIPEYDGSEIYIQNIKDLTFSLSTQESSSNFGDIKNINFNLSGIPVVIWKVDSGKLITDVLNKQKKDFNQILSQYSNVESAELSLSPFWKTSFPSKEPDIKVIVNYPK